MAESSEAVERHAVQDALAAYSREAEIKTAKDVPPGYKRTEVGVIPADWSTETIFAVADYSKSRFDDGDWVEAEFLTTSGVRLLQTGNIGVGLFKEKASKKYISTQSFQQLRCKDVLPGDLLICRLADPAGRACIAPDLGFERMITSVDVTIFRPSPELADPKFLLGVFCTPRWFSEVADRCGGSTRTRISRSQLAKIPVQLPSIEEQRAIATALSDADALIESLDRLIAKKRAIKQAAMQQLLTGQTRLPGFTGEWETKRLGDVIEKIVGGGTPSRGNPDFWGAEIPWVTVKDFSDFHPSQTQESITEVGLRKSASHLIPAGTLITSTRMALGKAVVYDVDVAINQDLKALFTTPSVDNNFVYYWFEKNAIMIGEIGSGSTVKGLSVNDLRGILFPCPPRYEQTAIATVLSDMDTEIEILERRRDKARQIKQGMMQQLLTGWVRLVSPEQTIGK
ncbi:restriction endonuclease subunit S [Halorhodospira halophila]|uniref:restriction endonuclease subunit S n=1 Tax=Halorhodospira halophila TaxID=1053 RepID=UPI0019140568|nr:restriction endonuclease subunit S [Halorhodospira halophila]MBK5944754.1 hypothetical protein [Halorhodospira halophila]